MAGGAWLAVIKDRAGGTGAEGRASGRIRVRRQFVWAVEWAALTTLVGYLLFRALALVVTGHVEALWLKDYTLYMDATQRVVAGGSFYPAEQLVGGPWVLEWGAILYPPVALAWFVPWSFLPA